MGWEASPVADPSGEIPFKIGVVPLPLMSAEYPFANAGYDYGNFISAESQVAGACWDWIKFLSDQPNLFPGVPARLSVAESPAWESSVGKEYAGAYRAAIAGHSPVSADDMMPGYYWPLNQWQQQLITTALRGEASQSLLIERQQVAESFLSCAQTLDTNLPPEELYQNVLNCVRKVDPEGNW